MKALIFQRSYLRTAGRFRWSEKKFSMSRNGPHTSTKKLSWWKSSIKIFLTSTIQNAKKNFCQVATL